MSASNKLTLICIWPQTHLRTVCAYTHIPLHKYLQIHTLAYKCKHSHTNTRTYMMHNIYCVYMNVNMFVWVRRSVFCLYKIHYVFITFFSALLFDHVFFVYLAGMWMGWEFWSRGGLYFQVISFLFYYSIFSFRKITLVIKERTKYSYRKKNRTVATMLNTVTRIMMTTTTKTTAAMVMSVIWPFPSRL